MNLLNKVKPKFWDTEASARYGQILFDYRKVWLLSFFLLVIASLFPLTMFMVFNLDLAHETIEQENQLRTVRITSNTRRTLTFFLKERLDALRFIAQEKQIEVLKNETSLTELLAHLQMGFGGYIDLGLINRSGQQISYAGPFDLAGKDYSAQEWFKRCAEDGQYISDVFLGFRQQPHLIIARMWPVDDDTFYILRTTLDLRQIVEVLSSLDISEQSDAFLCNSKGVLQTPSRYYGGLLEKLDLPIPTYSNRTQILETTNHQGRPVLIGYAYIEHSPFILMLVKQTADVMEGWYSFRDKMLGLFSASVVVILIIIYGMATFMLNKVYDSDQKRLEAMERLEGSSRLISLGRLAAGVAHEINNPLAVINENAGLIKDIFNLKEEYKDDQQLMELIDAILEGVERSGEITKELLGFARHFEPKITSLRLGEVMSQVLSFLRKEALYRNITITVDIPEDFPEIQSDRGSLQQIFLNLVNNAFQAMNDGGELQIVGTREAETVSVAVTDDGHGIAPEAQKKIFEPFFTTKNPKGGTGLGLSITYGLVKKLQGDISVKSKIGEGTTFTVTLPIKYQGDVK